MALRIALIVAFHFGMLSVAHSQQAKQYFIGYNSLNEVYGGVDFPGKWVNRFTVQAGYQIAFSKRTQYGSWWESTCMYGLRVRAGFLIPDPEEKNHGSIYLEYHDLQSNLLVDNTLSFPEFTESHTKFGIRVSNARELGNSNIFFTFSAAILAVKVNRTYVQSDPNNYKPDESSNHGNFQLTLGLKAYF